MATGTIQKTPVFQSGGIAISSSSTGENSQNITFPKPFANVPTVMCVWKDINSGEFFNGGIEPRNISTTGFVASAACIKAGDYDWYGTYLAFDLT